MTEHVKKIIRPDANTIVFVFKNSEESGYYWWEVSAKEVSDWFAKHHNPLGQIRAVSGNLAPGLAEQFFNSSENADKGTSSGEYETIEEILAEFGILKGAK